MEQDQVAANPGGRADGNRKQRGPAAHRQRVGRRKPGIAMNWSQFVTYEHDWAEDMLAALLPPKNVERPSGYHDALGGASRVYRGQADSRWSLLPSAFRPFGLRNHSTRSPLPLENRGPNTYRERRLFLSEQLEAEIEALFLFCDQADRLGLELPLDAYVVESRYRGPAFELRNRVEGDVEGIDDVPPREKLKELAIAQHHGVPTRLLDWTESSLVAAFFAAYGASSFGRRPAEGQRIAVFSLSTLVHDRVDLVVAPRSRSPHLLAQRGLFTASKAANSFLLREGRWPALEDDIKDYGGNLAVHTLRAEEADEILRLLCGFDITPQTLMPSLDSASRACQYRCKLFAAPSWTRDSKQREIMRERCTAEREAPQGNSGESKPE